MRIPESKIDEVRNSVNIVDVIGSVVRLKKAGKNHIGLCPFHEEKTASFSVNSEMQIYKCFGCGEGGNVFSFLMKDQNISFMEAVRQLAGKTGISLPRVKEDPEEKQKSEKLYAVIEFAAKWYQENLRRQKEGQSSGGSSASGGKAFGYLVSRGFKEDTIATFELGCAPDSWDGLVKAAVHALFDENSLKEAGLALQKSAGDKPYDRFRNRIIFPIKNEFGRTVGFGARKFDESDDPDPEMGASKAPKYINSPETPVYHKGRLLYGLYQNKDAIRKEDMAILVEGYTDVMSLYEHGIGIGVATLGTGLTRRQAQLINRYTKNVILLYDADPAGRKAALRGAEVLLGNGLEVQVVNLGGDADPDSFLRSNSRDAFTGALDNRKSIVEFYASGFTHLWKDLPYSEKTERVREIIDLVDSVKDPLKRELMLKEIGERLSTDTKTIFKEYYRKKRTQYPRAARNDRKSHEKPSLFNEIDQIERDLGSIMITYPELAQVLLESLEPDDIHNDAMMKIIKMVKTAVSKKKRYTPADLISAAKDDTLRTLITDLSIDPYELPIQSEDDSQARMLNVADDIIKKLDLRRIEQKLNSVQEQIKKAETSGNDTLPLISQYQDLLQRKNEIFPIDQKP